MIYLIDSSVWINVFRGVNNKQTGFTKKALIDKITIAICPPIYQEILQGVKTNKEKENIEAAFSALLQLKTDPYKLAERAADMYREARKNGITLIKPYDFLIAAYAIEFEAIFVHNDKDFDALGKLFPLNIYKS